MVKLSMNKKDVWIILKSFFEEKGLVRQHLDSFNQFLDETLQSIVKENPRIIPDIPDFYIDFGKINVDAPQIREADGAKKNLTPLEARIRELTYASDIMLEMTPINIDERHQTPYHQPTIDTYIGKLPIMLKSMKCCLYNYNEQELIAAGEDPLDPGGYFIVNGTERVLVTQEDLAPNRILIEEASRSSTATHIVKVYSTTHGFRAPVTIERRKDGSLRVGLPTVSGKIHLSILMRALGLDSEKKIFHAISDNEIIQRELVPIVNVVSRCKL